VSDAPRGLIASIQGRLLNRSRAAGEEHQFLLQRYAGERFLFRLGKSAHREHFILKGAMLFGLWGGSAYRPTRDLDFTGYGESAIPAVLACIRDICSVGVEEDGITFDLTDLQAGPIREEAEYGGLRVTFLALLGRSRIPMQIDIGFGNAIQPGPTDEEYPTLLDGTARPTIRAYPQEAVVAEKLHALAVIGEGNSRMKDLYDLNALASQFGFNGARVAGAISATFERRRTEIATALPAGLTARFYSDNARAGLWRAYVTRNRLPGAPDLIAVGERLIGFLAPVWSGIAADLSFDGAWPPGGPWTIDGNVEESRA
jgi:hypothetical protein